MLTRVVWYSGRAHSYPNGSSIPASRIRLPRWIGFIGTVGLRGGRMTSFLRSITWALPLVSLRTSALPFSNERQ